MRILSKVAFIVLAGAFSVGVVQGKEKINTDAIYVKSEKTALKLRASLDSDYDFELDVIVLEKSDKKYSNPSIVEARSPAITGDVTAEALVNPKGQVESVRILESDNEASSEAVMTAFKDFKFSPAKYKGKKVWVMIRQKFVMPEADTTS